MPGLVGVTCLDGSSPEYREQVAAMTTVLRHRDWYESEICDLKYASVAHVGTGIFPFNSFVERDGICVGLTGEIYDHAETSRSPLDHIRESYLRYGSNFARHLHGSFAIFIHDAARRLVLISTDHVSSRPVFWHRIAGGRVAFAPELKAILQLPDQGFRADLHAIADLLSTGSILRCRSLVQGVQLLDGGSVLRITPEGVETERYWDLEYNDDVKEYSSSPFISPLGDVFQRAVDRRVADNRGTDILLSGGMDSRGILGFLPRTGARVRAISYGFTRYPTADAKVAQEVASQLGVPHIYYRCSAATYHRYRESSGYLMDGMRDELREWPAWSDLRESHHVRTLWTGDECFGWHMRGRDELDACNIHAFDEDGTFAAMIRKDLRKPLADASKETLEAVRGSLSSVVRQNRTDEVYLKQRLFSNVLRMRYVLTADVELRTPWLDRDVLEFIASLPPTLRSDKRLVAEALPLLAPEPFEVPLIRGGTNRPLPGPQLDWFRTHRERLLDELLGEPRPIDSVFDPAGIQWAVGYLEDRLVTEFRKSRIAAFAGRAHPALGASASRLYSLSDSVLGILARKHRRSQLPPRAFEVLKQVQRIVHIRHALGNIGL
jgi:asparagine synthetase B (glutamine-hydrolysing)